ncbi:hypothetical protein BGZ74_004942, partial [Mortierella antarctica]
WANLRGPGQEYNPEFFNKIREAGGGRAHMLPFHGLKLDDEQMAMSGLCSHWVFDMVREYQLPYYKRLYMSNSRISVLWIHQSRLRIKDGDNLTSLSWRDLNFGCTLDAFYDYPGDFMQRKALRCEPESKASRDALARVKKAAKEWVKKNDKEGIAEQRFTKEGHRLFWGANDQDLVAAHNFYYDQEPHKYNELSALKQQLDPNCIFTANKFSRSDPILLDSCKKLALPMLLTIRWSIR